jgi:hypothetical protein
VESPSSVRIDDHTYASGAGGIHSTPGTAGNASAVIAVSTAEHARSASTDATIARAHLSRDDGLWMLPYWTMSSRKAAAGRARCGRGGEGGAGVAGAREVPRAAIRDPCAARTHLPPPLRLRS